MAETVLPHGKAGRRPLPVGGQLGGLSTTGRPLREGGVDVGALQTWDRRSRRASGSRPAPAPHLLGIDKPASQPDAANFFQLLLQLQGAFYFDLEGRITLDSPEAVRAMTLIKTMNDAGLVSDLAGGWNALMMLAEAGTRRRAPLAHLVRRDHPGAGARRGRQVEGAAAPGRPPRRPHRGDV
ncbi:hypothetical protein [Streptomyces showdoensis]|uniref:hypothetical protein n=1 Tax=Streptomyces showdoensis TaxID=68268 RepID=UPI0031E768D5